MNSGSPLARLASVFGIEPGYHDIWGTWHELTEDTARYLLASMGIAAEDDAAIDASLREQFSAQWARIVPPVCVRREDESAWLQLTLSEAMGSAPLTWRLREEGGAEHFGTAEPGNLMVLEEADVDGQRYRRYRLELNWSPCPGYHEVSITLEKVAARTMLIVSPHRCFQPAADGPRGRPWGIALQLYGVRSLRNWGIGDLGDLANAASILGGLGADLIGVNPLHALYPDEPERASPYSPSSRCFSNPLYLDVEAIPDFDECDAARTRVGGAAFQAELSRLRAAELVDYAGVAALKWPVLREIYMHFRSVHCTSATSARAVAFRKFQADGARALRMHAVFEVLHASATSPVWADEFLDPDSQAVASFADEHNVDVEFHEYLQWMLVEQIEHARERALAGGMRIGLYRDLAVGSDAFGADVWRAPRAYARDVSVGAPPDDFNLQGQVWGLPPWRPDYLENTAYHEYIAALRANMYATGALRIDHVIGLMRMFWVPAGSTTEVGAFVRYPLRDLLAILALESVRARCVIVGEDLGTVPDELRAALYDYGLLSYCVLYFSKRWHSDYSFNAPEEFPVQALATIATHDLPPFSGYWCGRDLDVRESLGLFPNSEIRDHLRAERARDRDRLLDALGQQGMRPESIETCETGKPSTELVTAVHRYLARSNSVLMMVQIEDVFGATEQANVPGTVHEHPNWRRRLDLPLEEWSDYQPLREFAKALVEERTR